MKVKLSFYKSSSVNVSYHKVKFGPAVDNLASEVVVPMQTGDTQLIEIPSLNPDNVWYFGVCAVTALGLESDLTPPVNTNAKPSMPTVLKIVAIMADE